MRLIPYDAHINLTVSPQQCVRAAEAVGLEAVGLVAPLSEVKTNPEEHLRQLATAGDRRRVHVVAGLQVEILKSDGEMGLPDSVAEQFPLVLAHLSEHTAGIGHNVPVRWERLVDGIFACLLEVVGSGLINVLAHPFNLGRFPAPLSPAQLPVERLEELGDAMAQAEVACELTNRAWWWYPELPVARFTEEFAQVLRTFSRCGVKFIAGSDSHDLSGIGNLRYVRRLMREAGVELSQLVNLTRL